MRHKKTRIGYFDLYTTIAPVSLAVWRSGEAFQLSRISSLLKPPILDIGCGFGEFFSVYFHRKIDIGIDISQIDIHRAKKISRYKQLIIADGRHIPLNKKTCNTVISISVFEHIKHVEKTITEAYRVLKPGGKLIITVPTTALNQHFLINYTIIRKLFPKVPKLYAQWFHQLFKHYSLYSDKEWQQIIAQAGFSEIKTTSTMSLSQLHLFEVLLPLAIPSQIIRLLLGYRGIVGSTIRSKLIKMFFSKKIKDKKIIPVNILITATKL